MTLRDRRKPVEDEVSSTPAARRVGRGRGGTPRNTPGRIKNEDKAEIGPEVINKEELVAVSAPKQEAVVDSDGGLVRSMASMATGSLGDSGVLQAGLITNIPATFASTTTSTSVSSFSISEGGIPPSTGSNNLASIPPLPSIPSMVSSSSLPPPTPVYNIDSTIAGSPSQSGSLAEKPQQKVFLRFTRPTSEAEPQTLHPNLPAAGTYRDRGVSEAPSTESDDEYISARSDLGGQRPEGQREL